MVRICDVDGCDRKHRARGFCANHYKSWSKGQGTYRRTTYPMTCDMCGEHRLSTRRDGRFCDDTCKGLWYSDNGVKPPSKAAIRCELPTEHPVRVLIRKSAHRKSPIRIALEAEDWPTILALMESRAVKVDGCWLWQSRGSRGYGVVRIAHREYGAHRLALMAHMGERIESHTPVHHKCAEPLCINPEHLQAVTPHENNAEMLERRYYVRRIAELEAALAAASPNHELLRALSVAA